MELTVIALLVVVVIVALALVALFATRRARPSVATDESRLPYRLKESLFSPAERSFYGVLVTEAEALGLRVFAKVRMIDLFWLPRNEEQGTSHRARIQQKHVDFVLCDSDRVAPVAEIELDDRSHERQDRRERDAFVDQVFKDAGLPLLHFPVKAGYTPAELRARLVEVLPGLAAASGALADHGDSGLVTVAQTPDARAVQARACPTCGAALVERVRRGSQSRFLGCSGFPNCRYTEAIPGQPQ